MKLLDKTTKYFYIFSALLLVVLSLATYFTLSYTINQELDESLIASRPALLMELENRANLLDGIEILGNIIELQPVQNLNDTEILRDTLRMVYDLEDDESELEPFRQYIYTEQVKGQNYRITLNHSKIENADLLEIIIIVVIVFFLLSFILINLFNRYISSSIWDPFYYAVDQLSQFKVQQKESIKTMDTDIDEFSELNSSLVSMTSKLSKDYASLKQFTENASHESQTPLAIIQAQIELLLQKSLDNSTLQGLQQIQRSTTKLSKLNQSLFLLTKIDNQQYYTVQELPFDEKLVNKLDELSILIEAKALTIDASIKPTTVIANPDLIEILLSNIVSNTIKYSPIEGLVKINLNGNIFSITNEGPQLAKAPEELFERFKKSDDSSDTIGLGLAIVKEICDRYKWEVQYEYLNQQHTISIAFKS